ncbi:MAG: hypothetical protein ICV77_11990 [Cyanobacteria bacterium Co-bin8]|nr:hypothetical protein [Cyanobacteria bacterium Co-bin8]
MSPATVISNAPDLSTDDYTVIGMSTCFLREEGEVKEVTVAEPVPSAYLEAVFKGVPTSYKSLHGVTLGEILPDGKPTLLKDAPTDAQLCADFTSRVIAATRTYKSRPVAKELLPLGTTRTDLNYSTAKKRVLNAEHKVSAEDNVKQHEHTHKVL